jgi:hypothetical protein
MPYGPPWATLGCHPIGHPGYEIPRTEGGEVDWTEVNRLDELRRVAYEKSQPKRKSLLPEFFVLGLVIGFVLGMAALWAFLLRVGLV